MALLRFFQAPFFFQGFKSATITLGQERLKGFRPLGHVSLPNHKAELYEHLLNVTLCPIWSSNQKQGVPPILFGTRQTFAPESLCTWLGAYSLDHRLHGFLSNSLSLYSNERPDPGEKIDFSEETKHRWPNQMVFKSLPLVVTFRPLHITTLWWLRIIKTL
jgi:hypothetical protein